MEIFSSVDHVRMVLPCGSKLGKNELMIQTHLYFMIRQCAYVFVSTAFYTLRRGRYTIGRREKWPENVGRREKMKGCGSRKKSMGR